MAPPSSSSATAATSSLSNPSKTTMSSISSSSSTKPTTTITSTTTTTSYYVKSSSSSSSSNNQNKKSFRYWIGMCQASIFTIVYFISPIYIVVSIWGLLFQYPNFWYSFLFAIPMVVSIMIPPIAAPSPKFLKLLLPMLDYFQYEQIIETKPIDVRNEIITHNKNYILAFQPHGVISMTAICSAIAADDIFCGTIPTGVATAVLRTPILKHIMGIFFLIDASRQNLMKQLQTKKGCEGTVVLYVGGMAELFLSSPKQETLYLKNRKGFIKLSLQTGVDIVPVYLFGNTTVLSVIQTGWLADMSRKLQISLTYFWGKWYLPIPRDEMLLYAAGQPLGIPHIEHPTQDDIDQWHAKYCSEVTRIFNTYKERVPAYKHKTLVIV